MVKITNDRLGHKAGDQVLQRVASVLKSTLRASDTVCRIGGDEFVIVAGNVAGDGVLSLIKKITAAIAEPRELADAVLTQRVSIGASGFPADGDQAEDLVRKADEAMYLAKLADRSRALPSAGGSTYLRPRWHAMTPIDPLLLAVGYPDILRLLTAE